MGFKLAAVEALGLAGQSFELAPLIRGWTRLEGRVRQEDFARALKAEARDPLWLLARQWQLLELKADDAGSPIEARLAMRRTKLSRFAVRGGPQRDFPLDLPLETMVEREAPPMDRVTLTQIARAFDKALLRDGVAPADRAEVLAGLRRAYPLDPARVEGVDDEEARQLAALTDGRLFDAARFLADPAHESTIDAGAGLPPSLSAQARAAAGIVKAWYAELYAVPATPEEIAWVPEQLEYQFSVATAPGPAETMLVGDGYAQGRLDWHAVDVAETRPDPAGDGGPPGPAPIEEALSFLPTAIRFAGMPSHRYWEMEDGKVDLGAMTAQTTDIAKMLLMELVFAYGNDWQLIPCEVEVGELCEALGLVVRDVFGDLTLVRPADQGTDEDWRRWAMFGLETRTAGDRAVPRLFMPPSTPKLMESPPVERVVFLRDEMANLVWAAEATVPSAAGMGVDGERYALSRAPAPPPEPPSAPGATARYRLGTDAPSSWRPFIPVRTVGSSIRLQRARLPEGSRDPLGKVLVGPGLAPTPYYLNEEEVPRAGRVVTRSFQRTRWLDGRVVLWLGRRTLTGRGEGRSGLELDVIEEIARRD